MPRYPRRRQAPGWSGTENVKGAHMDGFYAYIIGPDGHVIKRVDLALEKEEDAVKRAKIKGGRGTKPKPIPGTSAARPSTARASNSRSSAAGSRCTNPGPSSPSRQLARSCSLSLRQPQHNGSIRGPAGRKRRRPGSGYYSDDDLSPEAVCNDGGLRSLYRLAGRELLAGFQRFCGVQMFLQCIDLA